MKSKIFNCPDWVAFLLIAVSVIVPLLLGGCRKDKNNAQVAYNLEQAWDSTHIKYEQKYHQTYVNSWANGYSILPDTIIFHSDKSITEISSGGTSILIYPSYFVYGNCISFLKVSDTAIAHLPFHNNISFSDTGRIFVANDTIFELYFWPNNNPFFMQPQVAYAY
jgi:hypothetical protein